MTISFLPCPSCGGTTDKESESSYAISCYIWSLQSRLTKVLCYAEGRLLPRSTPHLVSVQVSLPSGVRDPSVAEKHSLREAWIGLCDSHELINNYSISKPKFGIKIAKNGIITLL
jgi:hypothetical protein